MAGTGSTLLVLAPALYWVFAFGVPHEPIIDRPAPERAAATGPADGETQLPFMSFSADRLRSAAQR
jgi:hypothetical protein